jgi:hypothetical protein
VTVATGASYTVTVGGGGALNVNGQDSLFGSISATGGGYGGKYSATVPNTGGSGGGGASTSSTSFLKGAFGVANQGNRGGNAYRQNGYGGAGGGGAGTQGLDGASDNPGTNGGAGIASAITGTVVTYAGGGGGSGYTTSGGTGGVGGGGSGAQDAGTATAGGGNTGGGGGGTGSGTAGAGGSGIVVVRYPGNVQFYTGGTVTYSNGYIVHNFTANGTLAPTTPTVVSEYQISRSLRFNPADTAYLNRTPATATNRRTWTWSAWIKRSGIVNASVDWRLFECRPSAYTIFDITNSAATYPNTLRFLDNNGAIVQTTPLYRDVSAWYHIVLAIDTTQATDSNRLKIYVNGVQVTSFTSSTYPTQNLEMQINTANTHDIGRDPAGGGAGYYDGYMTEINFIDGQQLTPTSFGYVNPTTGIWSPAKYVGAYGTNGFYLNFSDNSNTTAATLGADYSGNGNNWTPNNFSVTAGAGNDSLVDSPTSYGTDTGVGGEVRGNYCTLNPLANGGGTLTNGNLDAKGTGPGTATWQGIQSTIGMSSGKWYCEVTCLDISSTNKRVMIGLARFNASITTYPGGDANGWGYFDAGGNKYNNATGSAYGADYSTGDVIGVAFDADVGTLTFYKNNTSQGVAFSSLTNGPYFFSVGVYDSGLGTGSVAYNFGQRPFAYTAPSGFKALCTQNLPTPTIGATTATQAGKYFNPVTYTGTGSSLGITGVGFQPDLIWVKSRSAATDHALYDAVRGVQKQLESNTTTAETTETTGITAFGSDGFTTGALAQLNTSAATYVAWNWKANGAGSSNTAGSITSTVSANTTSGFSVVTWTSNGASGIETMGHGLGVAPAMIITKNRSAVSNWVTYHTSLGNNQYIALNTTGAASSFTPYWSTSSTTWGQRQSGIASNGDSVVAYCFAEVAGYSKIGSYTGNGSSDGTFVFTGMRPAYIMLKRTDNTSDWFVYDATRSPYNAASTRLYPDLSVAEDTGGSTYDIDFLSNGFKLRGTGQINISGSTWIFMAFASNPFKYSLAR